MGTAEIVRTCVFKCKGGSLVVSVAEEMESKKNGHVLLLPFPAQGHINPVLQFGARLASKGLKKITFATTVHFSKSLLLNDCSFGVELLFDGFDATNGEAGSRTLSDVIYKYNSGGDRDHEPITCLVYDSLFPWALDVGKQFGLITASFYVQPVSACLQLDRGSLDKQVNDFRNTNQADWLLFNSFDQLENKVLLKVMGEAQSIRTIGPLLPSMYLLKEPCISLSKPSDAHYIEWLNWKEAGSVLYVSFGSIAQLGGEQMEELVAGIMQSNKHFLWVVREIEESKLPDGFADRGLLLPWCSQLEVLAHKAVGCFLTNCGWNSIMEGLSLGVPMVAMPHRLDQITNAKFVEDVWGVGIRVNKNEMGIAKREELEACIREVMDGARTESIKTNAARWRQLAVEAVHAGGSSDLNITKFCRELASMECGG